MDTNVNDQITGSDKHVLIHLPSGEMSIAERIPPMPKSQLTCYQCRAWLEYVIGPDKIRCSRCNAVNGVPPPKVDKGVCKNCRVTLQFPIGSKKVKCGAC